VKSHKSPSKLVLGTAQLGLDYGIANKVGKPKYSKAFKILETAWVNGINTFDTAPAYGDSEKLIGEFINNEDGRAERSTIITKLPKRNPNVDLLSFINESINKSRKNLGGQIIDYYLLHNPSEVKDQKIIEALFSLKDKGLIVEPGASVYSVEEAEIAIENGLKVLQVPVNVFDQRFLDDSLLYKFKQKKVTLFARSIFLQGLFFIKPSSLPSFIVEAKPYLELLHSVCEQEGLSIYELALKFISGFP